jgi:hypothetical protein
MVFSVKYRINYFFISPHPLFKNFQIEFQNHMKKKSQFRNFQKEDAEK